VPPGAGGPEAGGAARPAASGGTTATAGAARGVRAEALAAAFAALGLATSCLAGAGDDTASVRVSLDLGAIELPAEGLPGPRGADGLLRLDEVPAYVQVEVGGPGLDPPLLAAWPEEGALTPRAVVELELDVPVGPQRRFSFLAYVWERREGRLRAWTDDGTIVRDLLEGGVATELPVTLRPMGAGTIAGTVDGPGAADIVAAVAVDGDPEAGAAEGPGVALPSAPIADGAFEVVDVPVGRAMSFRLRRADGTWVRSTTPAVRLTEDGERLEVVVWVP